MLKFRIVPIRLIAVMALSLLSWGCREAFGRTDLQFKGRNPAVLLTDGARHIVYVDPDTGRLVHRGNGRKISPVTPAGVELDLRGENAPLFTARPDGSLLVVYPVKLGMKQNGQHRHPYGELRAQASTDGGRTWSEPKRVDGDEGRRGHNFADLAVRPGGDAVVSWLDSRAGKQGVQAAVVKSDLTVTPAQTIDPLTCQCCRTALFASSTGDVILAYRDLTESKVRNMAWAVSRSGADFELRGDVADDAWAVNGCPESGPRFTETPDGAIWLAWFNGGASTIETASSVGGGPFERRGAVVQGPFNHPDLGTLPDGRLVLVYEALRDGNRAVELRLSDATHSRWSEPAVLSADGATPRYTRRGDHALVTYTTYVDGTPHVHVMDPHAAIEGALR